VEEALLAELPAALNAVTATLAERAAQQRDTLRLMAAVEPLARTRRYGNVRQVDTEAVAPVLAGLLTRVAVGLPAAVAAVDDDGLPVLRRTLATFPAPDRRALGSHLRRLEQGGGPDAGDETLDTERAARVLPRLRQLLGAPTP